MVSKMLAIAQRYSTIEIGFQVGHLSVTSVRHQIVNRFKESGKAWLFMMDDDVVPDTDCLDMVDAGYDIIGAVYPIFHTRGKTGQFIYPCAYRWDDGAQAYRRYRRDPYNEHGVVPVDGVGTGCIAIHRKVLEHPDMVDPFDMGWAPNGTMAMSEDLLFCRRAKLLGFTVAADFSRPADHCVASVSLGQVHKGYEEAFKLAMEKYKAALKANEDRPLVKLA